jgi:hypothetical protein
MPCSSAMLPPKSLPVLFTGLLVDCWPFMVVTFWGEVLESIFVGFVGVGVVDFTGLVP